MKEKRTNSEKENVFMIVFFQWTFRKIWTSIFINKSNSFFSKCIFFSFGKFYNKVSQIKKSKKVLKLNAVRIFSGFNKSHSMKCSYKQWRIMKRSSKMFHVKHFQSVWIISGSRIFRFYQDTVTEIKWNASLQNKRIPTSWINDIIIYFENRLFGKSILIFGPVKKTVYPWLYSERKPLPNQYREQPE